MSTLAIDVPRALAPLLKPARYKAARGGRGGAKSHFFAEQIVVRCFSGKTRAVCIREVQTSIKDSVRQLLIDKIQKLRLGWAFEVLESEIRGRPGTPAAGSLIVFRGMQSYNAENIKSLEDFDIAWVEEAQTFSATSLRLLRPTIRKDGSEIWFSWNTRHDTDAVDKFFFGTARRQDAIVVEVQWFDNPWFPSVLLAEKEADYASDPEMADHVWGGGYQRVTEGSYYAKHIAAAEREGRVGWFPYIVGEPVYTAWDIGIDDYTAIWFIQVIDGRPRIIDYYEASGLGADEIIAEALPEFTADMQDRIAAMVELGREKRFEYGRHFFPHDIGNREWGGGGKARVQTVNELGIPLHTIHRGIAQNPQDRINAVRRLLPICDFHQSSRVMIGVSRLRRYSRKKNDALGTYLGPLHDENSHGCLVAGSLVTMSNGCKKPIENIKVGEFVWTPSGNSRILYSGLIKQAVELVEIETCGMKLTCSPEHKLLTTAGFVEAGKLLPSMTILTGHEKRLALIGFISKVSGIGFRALITGERLTAGTISTAHYGQALTGKFQKAMRCITWMATHLTIIYPILRQESQKGINGSTASNVMPQANSRSLAKQQDLQQLSGTQATMGERGTLSTVRKPGLTGSIFRRFATIVAVNISRHILRGPLTVRRNANPLRVHVRKAEESVFDLTVENHASYQANGLYVSNSDAFGEFAVNCGIEPKAIAKAPEPKGQAGAVQLPPPPEHPARRSIRI